MNSKLKKMLQRLDVRQSVLARYLCMSDAGLAQLINHNMWPKRTNASDLQERIHAFLKTKGASDADLADLFDTQLPDSGEITQEEEPMLLRKQTLLPQTKKHFCISNDPFSDDIRSHEDMYVNPDIRYVREAMFQTARHGGMLAIIAESGAGKTTLMRDLEDRINRENQPVLLIRPYVLAMEDNDRQGKTMKSSHIAEAIMAAVAPLVKLKPSPEARFTQLHKALKESHMAGYRHCVIIDEAHSLPIPTIKHLKRFFELEVGFQKLVSIILVGQPELKIKLSERNQDVREVVQRCEIIELAPIESARLEEYLKFKLDRFNKPITEIIDASGIDAIRERLTMTHSRNRQDAVSLLYPLAIGNLVAASMNLAADIGSPIVNSDVVKGV